MGAWAISLAKGLVTGDYAGLDLTTPVMLVIVGALFGDAVMRHRYNGRRDGD